jgi:SPASM domain peptide maturase of grasp-with-spasm system
MLFEGKSHFIFPTNCFIIDGAERALIYDLHRGDYHIITRELSGAIRNCTSRCFTDLFNALPPEDLDFYEPFIEDLITRDCLIPTDAGEVGYFEPMDTAWQYPYKVSNAIIEYSGQSPFDLVEVLAKIEQLNCQAVEIRFSDAWDFSFYERLSKAIDGMIFRHIDMLIQYKTGQEEIFLFELKHLHPAFFWVTQYNAPEDKMIKNALDKNAGLKRTRKQYSEIVNDHQVYPKNFYINKEFFTESIRHNPYFNGKIVVLQNGSVQNATNQARSFGYINDIDLHTLLKNDDFTSLWDVSKDHIKVCKECEFRNMCMDSRIPFQNVGNEWEYAEPCNYNPYTCEWDHVEQGVSVNNA